VDNLDDVIRQAVTDTRQLADWLVGELDRLAGQLRAGTAPIEGESSAAQVRTAARRITGAAADHLTELAEAQRASRDHFTLAFFGRTGAGKSSVIEAFVPRSGDTISDGRLDNTTEVQEVFWQSRRLLDTPGINGWGRTEDSYVLEGRAEQAVREADIVVVCFDGRGQQISEFDKVADWVVRYHKPLVALVNVRNRLWGMPPLVPRLRIREGLAAKVDEQVDRIRTQLAAMNLPQSPVIAIHAQRAVAARATAAYRADDARTVRRLQKKFDRDKLWEWSNLGRLEDVIADALREDAFAIRAGRLSLGARGTLEDAAAGLQRSVIDQAEQDAGEIERALQDLLDLVGRPDRKSRLDRAIGRLLRDHETVMDTSSAGAMPEKAASLIKSALGTLRAEASRRAEAVVQRTMAERKGLDGDAFSKEVFRRDAMEVARKQTMADLRAELERRAGQVTSTLQADIEYNLRRVSADGRAGVMQDVYGLTASVYGVLVGLASFVLTPLAGFVVLAAGAFLKWAGRQLFQWGRRQREEATVAARAQALQAVADTFDQLENSMNAEFAQWCREFLGGPATVYAVNALELRAIAAETRAEIDDILDRLADWPDRPPPSVVVEEVWRRRRQREGLGIDTARAWVTDRLGLRPEPARPRETRSRPPAPARSVAPWASWSSPRPGSALIWLDAVEQDLGEQPGLRAGLAALRSRADETMPRVVVCGDYNAGKSSLIRRLFLERGLAVPDIAVGDAPTTDRSRAYPWDGLLLVDTPGFQSGQADHSEAARASVAEASAAVYLFTSAGVIGDRADLTAVVGGDPGRETGPLTERAVFLVGRCDDLADPHSDLRRYRRAVQRKTEEVYSALGRMTRGLPPVRLDRIHGVAADPDGLSSLDDVRREDLAGTRKWDGVADLVDALGALSRQLARNGVDIGVLRGGIGVLARWRHEREAEAAILTRRITELDALIQLAGHFWEAAHALRTEWIGRLAETLRRFTVALADGVIQDGDGAAQARMADRLERIDHDPELLRLIATWQADYAAAYARLERDAGRAIRSRVERTAFRDVFAERPARRPATRRGADGQWISGTDALRTRRRREERDWAVAEGMSIGGKVLTEFSTTLAEKAAQAAEVAAANAASRLSKLAKAGGRAFAVGAVAFELVQLWRSYQRSEAEQQAFRDLLVRLGEQVEVQARQIGADDPATHRTAALAGRLDGLAADARAAKGPDETAAVDIDALITAALRHRTTARRLLGVPDPKERK
jgi:predicted GTPase